MERELELEVGAIFGQSRYIQVLMPKERLLRGSNVCPFNICGAIQNVI